MLLNNGRWISSLRFNRLVQETASRLEAAQDLIYLRRCGPLVQVSPDELAGEWKGTIYAGDVITNDARAVVVDAGELSMHRNNIPNIKIGKFVPQNQLTQLDALNRGQGDGADRVFAGNWEDRMAADCVTGNQQRLNALACGMMRDSVIYDRWKVKIVGGFGMPANQKITVQIDWSNPAAQGVTDIREAIKTARVENGIVLNHMDLSQVAFDYLTAQTQFQDLAKLFIRFDIPAGAFDRGNQPLMVRYAEGILGITLYIDDSTFKTQNADGSETKSRYLPINEAILSNRNDHGRGTAYHIGNTIVDESIVASIVGGTRGIGGRQVGPVSYFTGPPDLNPPNVTIWSVYKAFPQKLEKASTARLRLGSFTS